MKLYQLFAGTFLAVSLSACGGGSSSAPPVADVKRDITTTAAAMEEAERSGALPALNRDTTILGVDANGNGVRDDLDAYIAALPDTASQKSALMQMASAISAALAADTTDVSAMLIASKTIAAAAACNHARYDSATASKKSAEIEKISINTKTRFLAYDKFNAALSGTSFVRPQGDGCAN